MSYDVYIRQPRETTYLKDLPLSSTAKSKVDDFILSFIANISDAYRAANRRPPGSYFFVQCILLDQWGDGSQHVIDFTIQDDAASDGWLLVVYVEHFAGKPWIPCTQRDARAPANAARYPGRPPSPRGPPSTEVAHIVHAKLDDAVGAGSPRTGSMRDWTMRAGRRQGICEGVSG